MSQEKLISSNPVARKDYHISEVVEAGIVLTGTEIKSIRNHSPALKEAFVQILPTANKRLEAWVMNLHIAPYSHGNIWNHDPLRKRKLLLKRNQIDRIHGSVIRDGMTAILLRMYFKMGYVKLELGLAKGKKNIDKREDLKKKSANRDIERAMKSSRNKPSKK